MGSTSFHERREPGHIRLTTHTPIALVAFFGVLASGCSGMKVGHQVATGVSFSAYRSFQWLHSVQPMTGIVRLDRPALDAVIRQEIVAQLDARGLVFGGEPSGTLLISYQVMLQSQARATGINIGRGGSRGWGKGLYTDSQLGKANSYIKETETGTLLIEMVDAPSNSLIWRGYAHAAVDPGRSQADRMARVRTAVRRIVSKLP